MVIADEVGDVLCRQQGRAGCPAPSLSASSVRSLFLAPSSACVQASDAGTTVSLCVSIRPFQACCEQQYSAKHAIVLLMSKGLPSTVILPVSCNFSPLVHFSRASSTGCCTQLDDIFIRPVLDTTYRYYNSCPRVASIGQSQGHYCLTGCNSNSISTSLSSQHMGPMRCCHKTCFGSCSLVKAGCRLQKLAPIPNSLLLEPMPISKRLLLTCKALDQLGCMEGKNSLMCRWDVVSA